MTDRIVNFNVKMRESQKVFLDNLYLETGVSSKADFLQLLADNLKNPKVKVVEREIEPKANQILIDLNPMQLHFMSRTLSDDKVIRKLTERQNEADSSSLSHAFTPLRSELSNNLSMGAVLINMFMSFLLKGAHDFFPRPFKKCDILEFQSKQ